jgi:SAM-dependent methyltransferase
MNRDKQEPMNTAKNFVLSPVRAVLGPERYEMLRFWGYRVLFKDQGYSEIYYNGIESANSHAYELLAETLNEVFQPRSVVDVGCGSGGISAALRDSGVGEIYPFDFSQSSVDMTQKRGFTSARRLDLTQAKEIPATADLCLCLEVAEHIPRKFERHLVALLSRVAPVLVFTAAPPGQGGHLHVNLRSQDHWKQLFREQGMEHDNSSQQRMFRIFGGRMIRDYSTNLLVFRRRN